MTIQSKKALDFSVFFFPVLENRKVAQWDPPYRSPSKYSPSALRLLGVSLVVFRGVVESRRFHLVNTMEGLINLQWRQSRCNANGDLLVL